MNEYRATAKIIKKHPFLMEKFLKDIEYCEKNNILITIQGKRVERSDGKLFPSGSIYWQHDTKKYPIHIEYEKVTLDEELFKL